MGSYHWYDFIGNIGAALIVLAFFLIQTGKVTAKDVRYSLINGIGACLIIVSLLYNFNLSSFMIEVFWITISLIGIYSWIKERFLTKAAKAIE